MGEGRAASFARYAIALTYRHAKAMAIGAIVVLLVWWPLDPMIYGDQPEILHGFAVWRIGGSVLCALGLLATVLLERRQVDPFVVAALFIAGLAGLRGHAMALAGGLDHAFFYTGNFIPFATIPMIWAPVRRVLATVAASAGYLAAYFATIPEHLGHEFAGQAFTFQLFGLLMSLGLGHAIYRLLERNHEHGEQLTEVNERLEARVLERTEQLRSLTNHIETSREEERRRLAREIHDEMGQLLTAMRMEVELARRQKSPEALSVVLERQDELVGQALDAARSLVAELRPRVLDDLGLAAASEWYLERFAERSGLACAWDVQLDGTELEGPRADAVFRILQESLTNVARHARASDVEVALRHEGGAVTLEVSDDGIGIGADGPEREGFGLLGMRERARGIGGQLDIGPREPSGTRLRLRVPLVEAREPLEARP